MYRVRHSQYRRLSDALLLGVGVVKSLAIVIHLYGHYSHISDGVKLPLRSSIGAAGDRRELPSVRGLLGMRGVGVGSHAGAVCAASPFGGRVCRVSSLLRILSAICWCSGYSDGYRGVTQHRLCGARSLTCCFCGSTL